jgi:dynein heavy chain
VQSLPKALGPKAKRHLEVLFDWALPACLRFVRKELEELSPSEDAGLARGAMRIIEACLDDFVPGKHLFITCSASNAACCNLACA